MSNSPGIVPKPLCESSFIVEDWTVQPFLDRISRAGRIIHLEPKAMQLLVHLAEHHGEVISREALINAVWGEAFVSEQVLTNAIWQLRQALGDGAKEIIETIPKHGYRLTAHVVLNERGLHIVHSPEIAPVNSEVQRSTETRTSIQTTGRRGVITAMGVVGIVAFILVLSSVPSIRQRVMALIQTERTSIAVLPFRQLVNDGRTDLAPDEFTEDLILDLGNERPKELSVIAWSAILPYVNSGKGVGTIGKELKVDYILEGGLRQNGGVVHVTVNMIDVPTQRQVWGCTYESPSKDIPLLRRDIVNSVLARVDGRRKKPL